MFRVYEWKSGVPCIVYAVLDDANGYPKFLIRRDNQWIWRSAKHYSPVDEYIKNEIDNDDTLEFPDFYASCGDIHINF